MDSIRLGPKAPGLAAASVSQSEDWGTGCSGARGRGGADRARRGGAVGDAAAWGDADAPPLRAGLGVLTHPRAAPGLGRRRSLP